ncbi:MAG: RNB domain-containing ribonuclease [Rhodocyclaceae bacterium]|nr:RNB domain-containing ribonuclease [Rhodocyclaceae bacterium]MBK6908341.1 RNB domain-containing ribonuclease [Rhodocyclaceae bacterium]
MNILFEEDGSFRAGTLMADNTTSVQVELPGGKRSKVKAANVVLRFGSPSPSELLQRAEAEGADIDVSFLWEVSPESEFGFEELAVEYCGGKPDAVQAASVLLRLHSAPMYFHRKGKGRYRKAPPEILQAALAGVEKKRQQALAIEEMTAQLLASTLPAAFPAQLSMLLYAPDRNRLETKALEAACAQSGKSPAALLRACGALPATHEYHFGRFLHEFFPEGKGGTRFPDYARAILPTDLPVANVAAFSIDDAATTEIDDAFSVTAHAGGGWRIGIHIAAPGLGFAPDSDLGRIARDRLSTVYMPGRKITMLPDAVVEQFTLGAGRTVPALSLYLEVASDLRITAHDTCLELVPIAANLRHHDIEPVFNEMTLSEGLGEFAYRDELKLLWELAQVLEAGRGQTRQNNRRDYSYEVDWTQGVNGACGEPGHVSIIERPRGSPLDTLVAELMIVANSTWGGLLRDAKVPALYRAQSAGKVRMTTQAAPHEGLGVDCYAWSSSPLRRYCDLLNQWQLISHLRGDQPAFAPKSAELLSAMRDFDVTYSAYAEFQRQMERYWCLRWLVQEARTSVPARIIREQLVRLEEIPLVIRLLDLPDTSIAGTGRRVSLAIDRIDLLEADIRARFVELLAGESATGAGDEFDEEELLEPAAPALAAAEMPAESGSDDGLAKAGEPQAPV